MKISIGIKRVALTTSACLVAAILPLAVATGEMFYTFSVPLLFSIAILLTNFDRITTKKKYHAFILSPILTLLLFFFVVSLGPLIGHSLPDLLSEFVICILSGLLILLINSIYIQINNIKFGLLVTGLLTLLIPPLTKFLKGLKLLNITFYGDPATFLIIWQAVIGLALAISIWTKISRTTDNN